MVRAPAWVVVVAGLAALGCSSSGPTEPTTSDPVSIIGGTHDATSRAIFVIQAMSLGLCSGSLIAPNLIMTAHHCVSPINETAQGVQCNTTMFGQPVPPSDLLVSWDDDVSNGATRNTIHSVTKVIVPPSSRLCGNDIALIELADVVPPDQAMPIEPRVDSRPSLDEPFEAVGYGIQAANDQNGATAGERMRIGGLSVGCVGASQCAGTGATGTEWAAEAPICSGDSGGPALDSDGRVIGIASRGDPDCTVGIYTAVDSWKTLIVDTAVDAAGDGGYVPPDWTTDATTMDGGVPTDAGTDASPPDDAGTDAAPDDAGADASDPGDAGVEPTDADPLGESCTGGCAGGYLCYSQSGKPPGVCVPPCQTESECPTDYVCTTALHACTPAPESPDASTDTADDDPPPDGGCGCRTAGTPASGAPLWLAGALVLAFGARRRRAPTR